jgi:hypothetical protein
LSDLVPGTGERLLYAPCLCARVVGLHLVRDCVVVAVVTRRPAEHPELPSINTHTKYIYIKSTTVYVTSSELGLSQSLSHQRVCPSPRTKRGGTLACGREGGGVPMPTTGEKAYHSAYSVKHTIHICQYKASSRWQMGCYRCIFYFWKGGMA